METGESKQRQYGHGEADPDWLEPVSYTHLDVYKRQGIDCFTGPVQPGQEVYAAVRHRSAAVMDLPGGGKTGGCVCTRQEIEEGGLTGLGQPHQSDLHVHFISSRYFSPGHSITPGGFCEGRAQPNLLCTTGQPDPPREIACSGARLRKGQLGLESGPGVCFT